MAPLLKLLFYDNLFLRHSGASRARTMTQSPVRSRGAEPVDATTGIRPDARLIQRGKFIAGAAAVCLVLILLIDIAAIAVVTLRMGDLAGLTKGGFSFVLNPWMKEALPTTFVPITHFAVWQSCLAAVLLAIRLAPGLVALWHFFSLFRMYGKGLVFTERNAGHVRGMAWALLAYAVAPLLTHATLYAAGMSAVAFKFEIRQIDALVAGIVLFALSYVVSFGCDIDREREGFI
ncbi:DUF2975 domain-containing protein [Dyella sp. AD56]|uniref:DUF2975 domain-containing protein n=1 Tax=Dyella sp. AD56 TaxID=1528744 RepID=UPI0011AFAE67|nr:DUF2975 domain-containing protein [Dyella sp. AD56]